MMMNTTLVRLSAGLLAGLVLGLVYGWLIRPVEYVDTAPASLRVDYRTDYVLMVAEAYGAEDDLELAQVRLAALGPEPPALLVEEALEFAETQDFSPADLERLDRLRADLESIPPPPEIGGR